MSWSYRIILAYTGFLVMIFYFVFVASQQNNELMDSHYYEKEKQFAQTLLGVRNLDSMGYQVNIGNDDEQVKIAFSRGSVDNVQKGNVEFICLSDKSKDLRFDLDIDSTGNMYLPSSRFIQAQYQVRIEWMNHQTPLAFRQKFFFQRT